MLPSKEECGISVVGENHLQGWYEANCAFK